jgi:hypothetical protein
MYCLIVLPFLLQYLTDAENLIGTSSVTSRLTMMIPSNFLYARLNIVRRIFDTILYEVDSNDIPR